MNSLPPDQRTMTTDDGTGTKIEAIPGMAVCDFCAATPVAFAYPCGLVLIASELGTHATSDPWSACLECHALIEADDRDALVQRALSNFLVEAGEQPAPAVEAITAMLAATQRSFFDARLGAARPV